MCVYVLLDFFFFSSRRRHTRWTGDWSSDVCSSDLIVDFHARREGPVGERGGGAFNAQLILGDDEFGAGDRNSVRCRSEERRVGKSVDLGGRRISKKKINKGGDVNATF